MKNGTILKSRDNNDYGGGIVIDHGYNEKGVMINTVRTGYFEEVLLFLTDVEIERLFVIWR